ncbi:MAG: hypothetical protein P4N60_07300 [Verrucomicrobiae bacterium]|nr:hypothetical protein [Verrucomicrobiae bacterium]
MFDRIAQPAARGADAGATFWIGLGILSVGKRRIPAVRFVEQRDAHILPH